jgi:hypothetical protein
MSSLAYTAAAAFAGLCVGSPIDSVAASHAAAALGTRDKLLNVFGPAWSKHVLEFVDSWLATLDPVHVRPTCAIYSLLACDQLL